MLGYSICVSILRCNNSPITNLAACAVPAGIVDTRPPCSFWLPLAHHLSSIDSVQRTFCQGSSVLFTCGWRIFFGQGTFLSGRVSSPVLSACAFCSKDHHCHSSAPAVPIIQYSRVLFLEWRWSKPTMGNCSMMFIHQRLRWNSRHNGNWVIIFMPSLHCWSLITGFVWHFWS